MESALVRAAAALSLLVAGCLLVWLYGSSADEDREHCSASRALLRAALAIGAASSASAYLSRHVYLQIVTRAKEAGKKEALGTAEAFRMPDAADGRLDSEPPSSDGFSP